MYKDIAAFNFGKRGMYTERIREAFEFKYLKIQIV